jgi:hypothetical protein
MISSRFASLGSGISIFLEYIEEERARVGGKSRGGAEGTRTTRKRFDVTTRKMFVRGEQKKERLGWRWGSSRHKCHYPPNLTRSKWHGTGRGRDGGGTPFTHKRPRIHISFGRLDERPRIHISFICVYRRPQLIYNTYTYICMYI